MKESLERLFARRTFGVKLGLDVELAMLSELGDPQEGMRVIHVAGTNGKGSVCALLDAIVGESGLTTGLYTSPHLVRFHERFRINGETITDTDIEPLLERIEQAADAVAARVGHEPTFFECATALAFLVFKLRQVDVAIIETGLGGRLDATNIISPIVSVITRLGIDHVRHLGADLAAIASEKCGIIKAGRPVVCGPQDPEAMAVIESVARERRSPLVRVEDCVSVALKKRGLDEQNCSVDTTQMNYGSVRLPLHGDHQLENLSIAVAVIEELAQQGVVNISPGVLKTGVKKVNWPGRCQIINRDPITVLDGAHNVSAAAELSKTLKYLIGNVPLALICGFCGDKDIGAFFSCLPNSIKKAWIVPVRSSRNTPTGMVREAARLRRWETIEATLPDALTESTAWATEHGAAVCVTGSLYLVGEILELEEEEVATSADALPSGHLRRRRDVASSPSAGAQGSRVARQAPTSCAPTIDKPQTIGCRGVARRRPLIEDG